MTLLEHCSKAKLKRLPSASSGAMVEPTRSSPPSNSSTLMSELAEMSISW